MGLSAKEDIVGISGYSVDRSGNTRSLQAESSAGQSWGPHGTHTPLDARSLRSSPDAPTNGLRLNHLSGDQTMGKYILRFHWSQRCELDNDDNNNKLDNNNNKNAL